MQKDILFLLAPGFEDNGRREYCPECAEIWGVLQYYPAILPSLEIQYQPIAKPRQQIVNLLGEAHQNCPTLLVMDRQSVPAPQGLKISGEHHFLDNARDIGRYFAQKFGTPVPRGD